MFTTSSGPPGSGATEAELPVLTAAEKAAGFQILEVEHHHDLDDWERTLKIRLPRFVERPKPAGEPGKRDFFRISVLKVLGECDAIFRVESDGRCAYSHLRWGHGSCWSYATFMGLAAWHPVSDPYATPEEAVARSSVKNENPGVNIYPERFASRPPAGR